MLINDCVWLSKNESQSTIWSDNNWVKRSITEGLNLSEYFICSKIHICCSHQGPQCPYPSCFKSSTKIPVFILQLFWSTHGWSPNTNKTQNCLTSMIKVTGIFIIWNKAVVIWCAYSAFVGTGVLPLCHNAVDKCFCQFQILSRNHFWNVYTLTILR